MTGDSKYAEAAGLRREKAPEKIAPLDEEILFSAIDSEVHQIDGLMPGLVIFMPLEIKRVIRTLPGRRYVRLVRAGCSASLFSWLIF